MGVEWAELGIVRTWEEITVVELKVELDPYCGSVLLAMAEPWLGWSRVVMKSTGWFLVQRRPSW